MSDQPPSPPRLPLWRRYRFRYAVAALLFALPALINFAVFRYYPIAWTANVSLWDYSLLGGFEQMVGAGNYTRALFEDPFFWLSLRVTAVYMLVRVPLQVILALGLAAFTAQDKPGMGLMRALIFVPVVSSFVVVSVIWGLVLNFNHGLLNAALSTLDLARIRFLSDPQNALPAIIAISIWKEIGYSVIILVAGLKGIPKEQIESALLDGANAWQRFIHVIVPLLRRPLLFVTVTTTLFAAQVFVPVYQLTQGGPQRATLVIVYYIYQQAFPFRSMGYAAALSIILLVLMLGLSALQLWLLRSEEPAPA